MRHLYFKTALIVLLIFAPVNGPAAQFFDVAAGKSAPLKEVVGKMVGADVLFIGEIHDNPLHHAAQLQLIQALHGMKPTMAIGLEMFTGADQGKLDQWTAGTLSEEEFVAAYRINWSYPWPLYRDLFIFARDNRIPLIALNLPKSLMSKVMAQGPSALPEGETPPKLSWRLNPSQSAYMETIARQVFGDTPPPRLLARLGEAQALRNATMAWKVARYRQSHGGAKVVVLAGVWHAVKNGAPELLADYATLSYGVILPELPEFTRRDATPRHADYLITE